MTKRTNTLLCAIQQITRRFVRCDRGVSAVEMALISPVLLIVFLGLMDYGIAVFDKMELNSSVRSGSQHALIN
ncbi:MAG: pilus assembly protein, partial [Rhodospirillaceae bacterium]|nr:pilus assembly protein [Rhodospirillaceae bacterium]